VCALISLGPYLYFSGAWVEVGHGQRLRLPWGTVQQLVPGLAVTHPLRLAVPLLAVVAGLAAVGLQRLVRGPMALAAVALLLIDGLVISGTTWPLPTAAIDYPAIYSRMVKKPDEPMRFGVLDLPTDAGSTMRTSRYLVWQAAHGRPIPYGPDARASTSSLIHSPPFRKLAALSSRRADEQRRLNLGGNDPGSAHPNGLRSQGIRWIVVHRQIDPEAAERTISTLESDLGPGVEVQDAVMWDLGVHAGASAGNAP
jgi:hypothetical protein